MHRQCLSNTSTRCPSFASSPSHTTGNHKSHESVRAIWYSIGSEWVSYSSVPRLLVGCEVRPHLCLCVSIIGSNNRQVIHHSHTLTPAHHFTTTHTHAHTYTRQPLHSNNRNDDHSTYQTPSNTTYPTYLAATRATTLQHGAATTHRQTSDTNEERNRETMEPVRLM